MYLTGAITLATLLCILQTCDANWVVDRHAHVRQADGSPSTQVSTDFPFNVSKAELSLDEEGALVAHVEYTSQAYIHLEWFYKVQAKIFFTDISDDATAQSSCRHGNMYFCTSILRIRNPGNWQEFIASMTTRNGDGIFTFRQWFQYNGVAGHLPYSFQVSAPKFKTHPPARVHFTPGQDLTLLWEFEDSGSWWASIKYYKYLDGVETLFRVADTPDIISGISSYTIGDMDVEIVAAPLDNGQINFKTSVSIRNPSHGNTGILRFSTTWHSYRLDVELVPNGEESVYPAGNPTMSFRSCARRNRTLFTPDTELCLTCSARGRDVEDLKLRHERNVLASSEGHMVVEYDDSPEVKHISYLVPTPSVDEDGGYYSCAARNSRGHVYEEGIHLIVAQQEPQVSQFYISYRDEEQVIFSCDARGIGEIVSIMAFEWYRDEVMPYTRDGWMEEMFVYEHTREGPFRMEVQHEEGSLDWHADIFMNTTQISFGPELADFFGCLLKSPYYIAYEGIHDVEATLANEWAV